jgi:hypothetical protein
MAGILLKTDAKGYPVIVPAIYLERLLGRIRQFDLKNGDFLTDPSSSPA